MQHLEVSCAVRPLKWPLGVIWLIWIPSMLSHFTSINNFLRKYFKFIGHKFGVLLRRRLYICWRIMRTISDTGCRYRGVDKFLARPTSRCVLFDGENISFDASLVLYINSINIPPIMIINRIYETQNLLSL